MESSREFVDRDAVYHAQSNFSKRIGLYRASRRQYAPNQLQEYFVYLGSERGRDRGISRQILSEYFQDRARRGICGANKVLAVVLAGRACVRAIDAYFVFDLAYFRLEEFQSGRDRFRGEDQGV